MNRLTVPAVLGRVKTLPYAILSVCGIPEGVFSADFLISLLQILLLVVIIWEIHIGGRIR